MFTSNRSFHPHRKERSMRKHNLLASIMIVLALALSTAGFTILATPASAATTPNPASCGRSSATSGPYGRVLPEGLTTNAGTAMSRVQMLVHEDANAAAFIACETGVSASAVASSKVVSAKAGHCVLGSNCVNTVRAPNGKILKSSVSNGKRVFTWTMTFRIHATKTVKMRFKYDCSNMTPPKGGHKPPVLKITTKVLYFHFSKSKSTKRLITCPSGQTVEVNVSTTVTMTVRVKTLVEAVALASEKVTASLEAKVSTTVTVKCGAMPPPPPTVTPPPAVFTASVSVMVKVDVTVNVTVSGNCPDGTTAFASAAGAGHGEAAGFGSATSTISQADADAKANAAAQANGHPAAQAAAEAQASANASAAAVVLLTCPNNKPVVEIFNGPQHVFVNGIVQICAGATDADHDQLLVTWSVKYGTASTAFQPDSTGAPQKWCTTYTAPGSPFSDEVVTAKANDGKSVVSASTQPFPIVADQF